MKYLPLILALALFTLSSCSSSRCCQGSGSGSGASHCCGTACGGPKTVKTPAKIQ